MVQIFPFSLAFGTKRSLGSCGSKVLVVVPQFWFLLRNTRVFRELFAFFSSWYKIGFILVPNQVGR